MKKLLYSILLITSLAQATDFKIATMNIRFFGKGGMINGELKDEFRDKWIEEFLRNKLPYHQGIMFQEIVDKERLSKLMKKFYMNCYSYEIETRDHQHVMFCLNNRYEFKTIPSLSSYAYWPVADAYRSRLRPALVGIVIEKRTNKALFTVAGLHLKARLNHTETRMNQLKELIKLIDQNKKLPPFVVLGDFNSHDIADTNNSQNDIDMMNNLFEQVNLNRLYYAEEFTFKVPEVSFQLDHIFIDQKLKANSTYVVGPCNREDRGDRFQDIQFYNQFVSDHCAVRTTLTVQ